MKTEESVTRGANEENVTNIRIGDEEVEQFFGS